MIHFPWLQQYYKNVYDDLETKETKGISGIYPTASLTDKKIDLGLLDTEQSFQQGEYREDKLKSDQTELIMPKRFLILTNN